MSNRNGFSPELYGIIRGAYTPVDEYNPFELTDEEKRQLGGANPAAQQEGRTFGEAVSDTGAAVMGGFASLGGSLTHLGDTVTGGVFDIGAREAFDNASKFWEDAKSDELKRQKAVVHEADGFVDTVGAMVVNPATIADLLAGSLPHLLPVGIAAKVGKGLAIAQGMKARPLTAEAAAALGTKAAGVATTTSMVTGGVLEGADAGSQAYNDAIELAKDKTPEELISVMPAYKKLIDEGMSHEDAVAGIAYRAGLTAQMVATPIAILASKVTGAAKLEADLFTGAGIKGWKNGALGVAREGVEEVVQEGGNRFGQNVGINTFADSSRGYGDDVADSAAMGLVAGVSQGGGIYGLNAVLGRGANSANAQDDGIDDGIDSPADGSSPSPAPQLQTNVDTTTHIPSVDEIGIVDDLPASPLISTGDQSNPDDRFKFELNTESLRSRIQNVRARRREEMNRVNRTVDFAPVEIPAAQPAEVAPQNIDAIEFTPPALPEANQLTLAPLEQSAYDNGVDFTPAPDSRTNDLAAGVEQAISKNIDSARNARMPENLKDTRLLRNRYRSHLTNVAESLDSNAGAFSSPDSLLDMAAKNGGLNAAAWASEGIDPADTKLVNNASYAKAFRQNGGMTPDDLAEFAAQRGFSGFANTQGAPDANAALNAINEELAGKKRYSSEDETALQAAQSAPAYISELKEFGSPETIKRAITLALEGKKLGGNQLRIVQEVLNNTNTHSRDDNTIKEKWADRAKTMLANRGNKELNSWRNRDEHEADATTHEAALNELMTDAIENYGIDPDAVKSAYRKYSEQYPSQGQLTAAMTSWVSANKPNTAEHLSYEQQNRKAELSGRSSSQRGAALPGAGLSLESESRQEAGAPRVDAPSTPAEPRSDSAGRDAGLRQSVDSGTDENQLPPLAEGFEKSLLRARPLAKKLGIPNYNQMKLAELVPAIKAKYDSEKDSHNYKHGSDTEAVDMGRVVHKYGVILHDQGDVAAGEGADLVTVYHGTDSDGWNQIHQSGRISMGSGFSPRQEVAQDFAGINDENDEYYVIKVRVPKSRLVVDPESYDDTDVDNAISDGISLYVDGDVIIPKAKPKSPDEPDKKEDLTGKSYEKPRPSDGVSVSEGRTWESRSPKSWKSDDGQIIADHSMTVGGKKQKMFMVFASQRDFDSGNNYATAESLGEAKSLVKDQPSPQENEDAPLTTKGTKLADKATENKENDGGKDGYNVSEPSEGSEYVRTSSDLQGGKYPTSAVSEPANDAGRGEQQFDLFSPPNSDKRQEFADLFGTIVKPRPIATISASTDKVNSIEDLAHLMASIRKDPQENFYAVAADKNGKVLRVMHYTRGTANQSSAHPIDVVAEAASIDGIHTLHLAHNHPSGTARASSADEAVTRRIFAMLDGTGINAGHHAIIARYKYADGSDVNGESGRVFPRARKVSIPVTERRFTKNDALDKRIVSPDSAREVVGRQSNALFLLNNDNAPVAIVTLSEDEMQNLRKGEGVKRVLSAIGKSNAVAAIIKTSNKDAAQNLARMLNSFEGMNVLDWLDGNGNSDAERGGSVKNSEGVFYSLDKSNQEKKSIPIAESQAVIDKLKADWKGHADVRLVETLDDLPSDVRQRLDADGKTMDKVQGIFHPKTGIIYLNANKITSKQHAKELVFHEAYTHLGLTNLFGKDVTAIMGRLYLAMGGQKGINDLAAKHGIDLSKYEKLYEGERASYRNAVIAEELLAHISESPKPKLVQLAKELIGAIRAWLRKNGFAELASVNDADIAYLLKQSRETITKGKASDTTGLIYTLAGMNKTERKATNEALKYSLDDLPEKSRKMIEGKGLLEMWGLLAQSDEAFKYPTSDSKDIETVFREVAKRGFSLERQAFADKLGRKQWAIMRTIKNEETGENEATDTGMLVVEKGDEVWLNVALGNKDEGGSALYAALGNYAYNAGKVFIGDPNGLSPEAVSRRLENMISLALKFGTTKHIRPHAKQVKGAAGVDAVRWIEGADSFNLRSMIAASYKNVLKQIPEIEGLRYDVDKQSFVDENGNELTSKDIENYTSYIRSSKGVTRDTSGVVRREGIPFTVGGSTVRRAVLTNSFLRGSSEEQSELLASMRGELRESSPLREILYSLDSTNETRSQGGFSVSELGKKIPYFGERIAREEQTQSLPPSMQESFSRLGQNKTFIDKFTSEVKRQLTPAGLLPQPVFDLKVVRDGEINGDGMQTKHTLQGFYDAVEKAYGMPYKDLKRGTKREINKVLRGEPNAQLSPAVISALGKMRDDIKRLSAVHIRQLADDAADLQAQGKDAEAASKLAMLETISQNFDTYLHRSYRAFDDKNWPDKVPASVYQDAVNFLASEYADGGAVTADHIKTAEKRAHMILHEGTAFDSMGAFISESKLGAKDLSIMKKRKDVPAPIRALLGEYEDAAMNYVKSVTKMSRLVHNHAFLISMKQTAFDLGLLHDKQNLELDATKKIAADASEAYAPLNGLYTTREFEQALKDVMGKHNPNAVYDAIVAFNGMVKMGKTVLAPTTAMRNFMSSLFFTLSNGHFNYSHAKTAAKTWKVYFAERGNQGVKDYMIKLRRLGVIYDSPYASEMMDLMKDAKLEGFIESGGNPLANGAKWALQWSQKFYSFGDDFYKIIGFENEKALLMEHRGMSEAQAEKEAAERIRNTYPTYSMIGKGVNALRRFPLVGTFVSFPAEIIRTSYNITKYLLDDIKAYGFSDPIVKRKLAGYAIAAGLIAGISAASAAMFGVDDDEEDAIRAMAPKWQKNSTFLWLWKDENGNRVYVDLSFLDPYGYWKRPITAVRQDQPLDKAVLSGATDLLSPFLSWDIAAKAIGESAFNGKVEGGKVYNEADSSGGIALSVTNHLRKAAQPGFVTNIERFILAGMGEKSKTGKPYKTSEEVAALFGWRAATFDPKVALYYQAFEYQDNKSNASKILSSVASSTNSVSDEDLRAAYEQSMKARAKAFDDMGKIVNAAKSSGMSNLQLLGALRNSGVSVADSRALISGKPPVFAPSKTMMKGAIKKSAVLFDTETQAEFKRREKYLNDLRSKSGAAHLLDSD